jgi:hypothetical protein
VIVSINGVPPNQTLTLTTPSGTYTFQLKASR